MNQNWLQNLTFAITFNFLKMLLPIVAPYISNSNVKVQFYCLNGILNPFLVLLSNLCYMMA